MTAFLYIYLLTVLVRIAISFARHWKHLRYMHNLTTSLPNRTSLIQIANS
jgi:hypothetical protein